MQVRIDRGRLLWWCTTPEQQAFDKIGHVCVTERGNFSYIDRGSNVLAVAHLDTALRDWSCKFTRKTALAPSLDDRLGAYVICDLLPTLGVTMDVLLTDGEERGWSTAAEFHPDKTYNWIVSFDRAGTDVVQYQYETDDSAELLGAYGLGPLATGSFSDVCELEHLGCKAFNVGIGYHKQHTPLCYANFKEVARQVVRFKVMHDALQHTHMPHVEAPKWGMKKWDKYSAYASPRGWDDALDCGELEYNGGIYEYRNIEERYEIEFLMDVLDSEDPDPDEFAYAQDTIWEFYVGECDKPKLNLIGDELRAWDERMTAI